MLWGMPWSCCWGPEDEMIATFRVVDFGDGPRVRFRPQTGYAQYYRLQIDGVFQNAPVWAPDDDDTELLGVWESADTEHVISIVPQGRWASEEMSYPYQQACFQEDRAERLHVDMTTTPTLVAYGDAAQFSGWTLTGLTRFQNCEPATFRATWGRLAIVLTTDGGTHTLALLAGGKTVASGSRLGDGAITLTEQNASGLSGSVTLTYTADIAAGDGAYVVARFPAKLVIHHKTSAFTAPDFPRDPEATIYDDGYANAYTYRSVRLAAGTYYVVTHQVDECGNESTGLFAGGDTVDIVTPPEPVDDLAYVSGMATDTRISWTASTTPGATYNVYDSGTTGQLDLGTVADTEGAGSGTIQYDLAAITADWTGTRYVLIRAVSGGVEEGSIEYLAIEYADGYVVPARPAAPSVMSYVTTDGLDLSVPVHVLRTDGAGTPVQVMLYVQAPGVTPTWTHPDDVVVLGTAVGQVYAQDDSNAAIALQYTAPSNGRYTFAVRTTAAIGAFVAAYGDASTQLSDWSLSGVDADSSNGGYLYWTLTDSGGTRTVSVYSDPAKSALVAQGSRSGDGEITLAEQNSSGVSGSVTVAYSGDDTDAGNALACVVTSENEDLHGPVELTTAAPADPVQDVDGGL